MLKIFVTEMPKTMSDCPFCQNGECGICHNDCVVEECCCLEQLVVHVKSVEDEKNVQECTDN